MEASLLLFVIIQVYVEVKEILDVKVQDPPVLEVSFGSNISD